MINDDLSINESQHAISDNPGYGYHGTIDVAIHKSKKTSNKEKSGGASDDNAERAKHYRKMHQTVRSATGADARMTKHYLDSKHGRHLADVHNDTTQRGLAVSNVHNYIKKDFASFKKHYKPELFEGMVGDFDLPLIAESTAILVKRLVKEAVRSADKKPVNSRDSKGRMVIKMVTRKRDIVDAGGKDADNETLNKI